MSRENQSTDEDSVDQELVCAAFQGKKSFKCMFLADLKSDDGNSRVHDDMTCTAEPVGLRHE